MIFINYYRNIIFTWIIYRLNILFLELSTDIISERFMRTRYDILK